MPSGFSWGTQTMDEWDAHYEPNLLFPHPQGIGSCLYTLIVQSVWGPRTLASPGSRLELQNLGPYPTPYRIRILTRPPRYSRSHCSLRSSCLQLCQQVSGISASCSQATPEPRYPSANWKHSENHFQLLSLAHCILSFWDAGRAVSSAWSKMFVSFSLVYPGGVRPVAHGPHAAQDDNECSPT